MTNGEKLQSIFPEMEWEAEDNTVLTDVDNGSWFSLDWWNAEYKESTTPNDCETCIHNKGVLECDMYGCKYEPTTKNDLAVDCISRTQAQTKIEMNASRYTISKERGGMGQVEWSDQLIKISDAVNIIRNLPPVTPQLSSELEKNSKLEKGTTKNDLGVDAILRAEVNQVIEDYMDEQYHVLSDRTRERAFGAKVVMARINELPSVTPQEPRWIPVSEKLPNDRNWYLGIFKEPDTGWINPLPYICDYVGHETKATTKEHWILRGFTDWDDYHIDYYFNLECVAWMPLPESFETQERSDKE